MNPIKWVPNCDGRHAISVCDVSDDFLDGLRALQKRELQRGDRVTGSRFGEPGTVITDFCWGPERRAVVQWSDGCVGLCIRDRLRRA